jgi:hypothetical protein
VSWVLQDHHPSDKPREKTSGEPREKTSDEPQEKTSDEPREKRSHFAEEVLCVPSSWKTFGVECLVCLIPLDSKKKRQWVCCCFPMVPLGSKKKRQCLCSCLPTRIVGGTSSLLLIVEVETLPHCVVNELFIMIGAGWVI